MSMSTGYFGHHQQQHYGGANAMDGSMMDTSYGGPSSLMSSYSYSQYNASAMQPPRSQVYTPSGHQQTPFYSQSDFTDSRCFITLLFTTPLIY